MKVTAIIVAGGSGTRMGMDKNKAFIPLLGDAIIKHTVNAFCSVKEISKLIIVTRKVDIPECQEIFSDLKVDFEIIEGGKTRQESVRNGFSAISKGTRFVAIHDGARCLITPSQIEAVCREAYKHDCATAATRAVDSIKVSSGKNLYIESSANRNHVWMAQTPQVFKTEIYELALKKADADHLEVTDDNSLVENLGVPIKLVECGRSNIKITTPDDIPLALAILKSREEAL